jgi:predicted ATPase/DNA-binding winged helix-turn-helix (wHTH) protein
MEAGQEGNTEGFAFGRFRIFPRHRRMLAGDEPVDLGGRAFDVLLALIEAPGAVVGKDALMNRVWPDRIVEENNLQAQISALRHVIGPNRDLIRTIAGRGYQFTGEIRTISARPNAHATAGPPQPTPTPPRPPTNLPQPMTDMICRDIELQEVVSLVGSHRLVTLTGAGGIGKTRIAYEVARELLPQFPDGVWVAELSSLGDADLVPVAIAAAIGLDLAAADASTERVAAALAAKELLIVLDTCEHVIDAAARMAEALLGAGAKARVIATSREALKVDGEWVYHVGPLSVPTEDATDLLEYGSVSLFLERTRAMQPGFTANEGSVLAIAAICRRLDGIPLAIEMAAARATTLGVSNLATCMDDHLRLLTSGRRTALPRHQTLRATLDWSYELLTDSERSILRRLAMFRGAFGLEAAKALAVYNDIARNITDDLTNLVAKSLVSVEINGAIPRYRLLETTRAYALEKLAESGELDDAARNPPVEYDGTLKLFEPVEPVPETSAPTESFTDPSDVILAVYCRTLGWQTRRGGRRGG